MEFQQNAPTPIDSRNPAHLRAAVESSRERLGETREQGVCIVRWLKDDPDRVDRFLAVVTADSAEVLRAAVQAIAEQPHGELEAFGYLASRGFIQGQLEDEQRALDRLIRESN